MRKYRFDFYLYIQDTMLREKTNIARDFRNDLDLITISNKRINDNRRYTIRTNVCVRVSREIFATTNKFNSITSSTKNKRQ